MRAIPGNPARTAELTHGDDDTSHHPRIGRFRLDDLIFGDRHAGLWRAYDERLKRAVSVRIVPASDPRQQALRAAALQAARVVDRRVAQVLDVIDFDTELVIVAEWVEGINLEEILTQPLNPARSIAIAREVAAAVAAIHAAGASHGRIRPACVLVTDGGEVRLRGHCIDAQLWGTSPGHDPEAADIYGIGALLMACLTTRWPCQPATNLRSVPVFGDRVATPSQLQADLSPDINDFVIRSLSAVPRASGFNVEGRFSSVESARRALGSLSDAPAWTGVVPIVSVPSTAKPHPSGRRVARRGLGVVVALAVIITCTAIGGALLIAGGSDQAASAESSNAGAAGTTDNPTIQPRALALPGSAPEAAIPKGVRPVPLERELPINSASSFDPNGNGIVSGGFANYAIDEDPASAWYTAVFPSHRQGLKAASGILIDLGFPRAVRAVDLGLIGNDSDLQVRVGDRRAPSAAGYKKLYAAKAAPGELTVREPRPVVTRYVLVLLTAVPLRLEGYRGGVTSVIVWGD
ncbi:MAG: hypothetical protein ACOYD1_07200 [Candidatus Nanopelagicales bacterium]